MILWKALFDRETLQLGQTYCDEGRVRRPQDEMDGYRVNVRGRRVYRVDIYDLGKGICDLSCSCEDSRSGKLCRHMAAALYSVESFCQYAPTVAPEYARARGLDPETGRPLSYGGPGSGPDSRGRSDAFSLLDELAAKDRLEREAAEEEAGSGADSMAALAEYRYFDTEAIRRSLQIDPRKEAEAMEQLRRGSAGETQISLVHMDPLSANAPALWNSAGQKHDISSLHLEVIQSDRDGKGKVTQIYGRNSLVRSTCSHWECSGLSKARGSGAAGRDLCVHELMAFLTAEDYLKRNNVGDSTSSNALPLLESFIRDSRLPRPMKAGSSEAAGDSESAAPALTLSPKLTIDSFGHWSVQFRAGDKKLYKVNSIPELLNDFEKRAEKELGKTSVLFDRNALDDAGKRWLDFISSSVDTLYLFMGEMPRADRAYRALYFYRDPDGWCELKDSIPLYGNILDCFFDTAGDEAVDYTRSVNSYTKGALKERGALHMRDGNLRPALTIAPFGSQGGEKGDPGDSFEGVRLSGRLPELLYGSAYTYYLEDDTLFRISREEGQNLRPLLEAADPEGEVDVRIGRGSLSDFYRKALPSLQDIADISEEKPEIARQYLPEHPQFVCYLDVEDDCVMCRPEVYYGRICHSLFDVLKWQDHKSMPEHYRDQAQEESVLQLIKQYLPNPDENNKILWLPKDEEGLFNFLDHGIEELLGQSEIRATDRFMRLRLQKKVPIRMNVSLASNILNLKLTSGDLSPAELMKAVNEYRRSKKYTRLTNGNFLRLENNEDLERLSELLNTLQVDPKELLGDKMHLPAYRALYVDKMAEQMDSVYAERDSHFKNLIKEFKTIQDADYEVPPSLQDTLRNYQAAGYRWLRTLDGCRFGGILADDMGLGKTLQAITLLLAVHEEEADGRTAGNEPAGTTALIVCPASLVYNWEAELHRFAPSLKTAVIAGSSEERKLLIHGFRHYDVLVTSYDLLRRDIADYEDTRFRFEIIDEAQYIKNHTTANAKCVKLINAQTRFALSGTPIENRLSELWSIFDYIMPGFLYEYPTFRNEFEIPVMKKQDEDAAARLRRMVTPFILRRTKQEVLKDLPDKIEEIRFAGFAPGGEQQHLYDAQVVRMREDLLSQTDEEFRFQKIQILAEITRLRQICCDPALLYENYAGESAKREACMELLREAAAGGHKALVFSQFTSMLDLLKKDLREEQVPYYEITGTTPKEERVRLVSTFNRDTVPVFLISLKAGGTGLNLTGADVVIHYDPWWNFAVQNQATDRAHRIGQTRVVNVYKLILKDTIEERIVEMQDMKKALAEDILSANAISSASLSREDLIGLLGG